ncbi:MAG: aspartate aminotransferase family protein [Pirellulaceae bacterium]|nr:MAG: aspartate aminotransferase family protein [Pirellulaceae bacterium]
MRQIGLERCGWNMATTCNEQLKRPIEHDGEPESNRWRQLVAELEPKGLRTYTPSLAVIARAEGSYVWTPEGRRLADFTSGVLVANLGHNPRNWWQRLWGYLELDRTFGLGNYLTAVPLTSYNAVTPLEVEAARRLVALLRSEPGGARMEQVLWAASGSEAVQKALWAALKFRPGRNRILATRFGFHGKKGLAGAVTGSERDPERDPRVRFIRFPLEECIDVAKRREPIDLSIYEEELERIAEQEKDRLACLITEPYLGGGGSYHPQPEYLQLLERFCRRHEVVFILDEIQSNFGRTGPLFAFTHYGIEPDIVCLGKGLGNGIAVSAAVGRRDILECLDYGEGSDTFSGNPLASAAVLATLDAFADPAILENARQLAAVLETGLTRLKKTGLVAYVRGEGCVWGVECAAVAGRTAAEVAQACVLACYQGDPSGRAIHLLGPLAGKVLRVSPPLTMVPAEAADYLDAMYGLLSRLANDWGVSG